MFFAMSPFVVVMILLTLLFLVIGIATLTGRLVKFRQSAYAGYDIGKVVRTEGVFAIYLAFCWGFAPVMQYLYPERFGLWIGIVAVLLLAGAAGCVVWFRINRNK